MATLITLQAEIRDNTQAVQSDLGGDANGHLGLVCSAEAYQALLQDVHGVCAAAEKLMISSIAVKTPSIRCCGL